jgi:hypothetical protein
VNEVDDLLGESRVELSEMLGHILDKGVVLRGEVMLAVADIDLIKLDLGLLLTGVETVLRRQQARSLASAEVESVGELPDSTESETVRALNPPSSAAVTPLAEVEKLGVALLRLNDRMQEMKATFGLTDEDLQIDLGPLGKLR